MPFSPTELLGWAAASLVLLSFSLKTMVALRVAAIASNVAFFSYGLAAGLVPVMVLHGLLLPLNLWRLHQMRDLLGQVRRVAGGRFSLDMLLPYMSVSQYPAGHHIFQEGDPVEHIYLILEGRVLIERVHIELGKGELLGEMGVFTRSHQRTAGATCLTDVRIGSLTAEKFWQVFYQDPSFGTYVMQTIVERNARQRGPQVPPPTQPVALEPVEVR
ncbi:Crp/Fnr family transcriptional regulator [Hydrogenophaga sp. OTU3427]|uniref:Crp/Fnr family transcriptional regulator n=1 Tax=Hydrogenophaga sp. OTU3427 TaxID=3043856 RepID=UPI00313CF59B